jgi:Trypsin-co-occurring domain 1
VKRLVAFPTGDGESLVVEVDEPEMAGTVRAARPGEIAETARVTFEEALSRIRPAAEGVIGQLRNLTDAPDQVGVEFGLKLSAQAGVVVAAAAAEANYKVTLTWHRRP